MEPEEIGRRRLALWDELAIAKGEVNAIEARLRALQDACRHPDEFETSHMGETCLHCPDCGHCA